MPKNPFAHGDELYAYLNKISVHESEPQRLLREITATMESAAMQISPDQGQFMAMLVKLIDARTIVEVGTFTGYSALSMAQALPEDGKLIACDVSTEWTNIGKPFWEQAGVDTKIDLRIGPAVETLDNLLADGYEGGVDMMFIDADKINYRHYYERGVRLLRQNGLIVVDNVFWSGRVVDKDNQEEDTVAIRELNARISGDERVDIAMIAVGDGLFLARKI